MLGGVVQAAVEVRGDPVAEPERGFQEGAGEAVEGDPKLGLLDLREVVVEPCVFKVVVSVQVAVLGVNRAAVIAIGESYMRGKSLKGEAAVMQAVSVWVDQ